MSEEYTAKPKPKPDPDNQDVLDAIERLSERLQPVTNADLLTAVHGVSQQVGSIQTGAISVALRNISAQIADLRKEIEVMSGTLEEQLRAGLATLSADMDGLAADVAAIASQLTPGSTITQADIDALNAVVTSANNVKAAADALVAAPPAP